MISKAEQIIEIISELKEEPRSLTIMNYLITQYSYNMPAVIKTGTIEQQRELLNDLELILTKYQNIKQN